jgi:hypothetical protein
MAETSVAVARQTAGRPVGLHQVTMLLAVVVTFGALCVNAGYGLAAPVKPFWVASAETLTPLQCKVGAVLAVPAGWIVFALLLPAAVYAARLAPAARERRVDDEGDVAVAASAFVDCLANRGWPRSRPGTRSDSPTCWR